VLPAYRCALASPHVTAAAVEATEFPQLADRFGVLAVPRVVVNDEPAWDGAIPQRDFLARLLALAG
jgi:protein-disulfide isomerase